MTPTRYYCPNHINRKEEHWPLINYGKDKFEVLNDFGKTEIMFTDCYFCNTCHKRFISTSEIRWGKVNEDVENIEQLEINPNRIPERRHLNLLNNEVKLSPKFCDFLLDTVKKDMFMRKYLSSYTISGYETEMDIAISTSNINSFTSYWNMLIKNTPYDIFTIQGYYLRMVGNSVLKDFQRIELLENWYNELYKYKEWDALIEISKHILKIDNEWRRGRHYLIECYKNKYRKIENIENKFESCLLNNSNIFDAIKLFEEIAISTPVLKKGKYVRQKKSGEIGRIISESENEVEITFGKSKKTILKDIVIKNYEVINKNSYSVIKARFKLDEFMYLLCNETLWILIKLLKESPNGYTLLEIKKHLKPSKNWDSQYDYLFSNNIAPLLDRSNVFRKTKGDKYVLYNSFEEWKYL